MSGQRFALLVGVSEYGEGYQPLPGTVSDLERMQQVLQDPDIGGFTVKKLLNPEPQPLREAIEQFFRGRDKSDVLLFYFSGHGALDAATGSQLYLTTKQTRKEAKQLVESSAVEAAMLHRYLVRSKSQQKIVVLDCCFSGAVANLLKKGEGPVNLQQLEAQGTVLLASCSAFDVSYQAKGGVAEAVDVAQSLYTRYLLEGIETGAARKGKSDWIYTQDLHDYAKQRFKTELAAATEPQIIVVDKEGYQIPVVRAPRSDPKVEYRQIVAELLQDNEGELDELDHIQLEYDRDELEISLEDAQQILQEQQTPYLVRREKQAKYVRAFETALQQGYPISSRARRSLKRIQQRLSLRNEDVEKIERKLITENSDRPTPIPETSAPTSPPSSKASDVAPPSAPEDLSSERDGISYARLKELLGQGKWQEADRETADRMLEVMGRQGEGWLRVEDIENFPCKDLKIIDRLWVEASDGRFGFSVQKKIWQECGSPTKYNNNWKKFGDRVGWRVKGEWIDYSNVTFNTKAPYGHLPVVTGELRWGDRFLPVQHQVRRGSSVFSRVETCKL